MIELAIEKDRFSRFILPILVLLIVMSGFLFFDPRNTKFTIFFFVALTIIYLGRKNTSKLTIDKTELVLNVYYQHFFFSKVKSFSVSSIDMCIGMRVGNRGNQYWVAEILQNQSESQFVIDFRDGFDKEKFDEFIKEFYFLKQQSAKGNVSN